MRKRDENIEEKNQPPLLMTASFFNFESSPNSDSGSDELEEEWQKSKQEFLSALYHAESYASERESLQMPALDASGVLSLKKERLSADFDNEFNKTVLKNLSFLIQFLLRLIALNVDNPYQFRTILNDHLPIPFMQRTMNDKNAIENIVLWHRFKEALEKFIYFLSKLAGSNLRNNPKVRELLLAEKKVVKQLNECGKGKSSAITLLTQAVKFKLHFETRGFRANEIRSLVWQEEIQERLSQAAQIVCRFFYVRRGIEVHAENMVGPLVPPAWMNPPSDPESDTHLYSLYRQLGDERNVTDENWQPPPEYIRRLFFTRLIYACSVSDTAYAHAQNFAQTIYNDFTENLTNLSYADQLINLEAPLKSKAGKPPHEAREFIQTGYALKVLQNNQPIEEKPLHGQFIVSVNSDTETLTYRVINPEGKMVTDRISAQCDEQKLQLRTNNPLSQKEILETHFEDILKITS
ncbi:hypothetical protein [Coxiella burnetii]|uniref:hypothetical protein n=1 Tax=Coxiella burnetii TaxID=777 RepID=UPI000163A39D|nr:hypothetical protein [Coxiella burnetii]ATN85837.1 hypothetical protein AYO29_04900 [Coxiella burnetii str. Schperling]EDR35755.1 hypothetical protein COXBURSA334_1134 [Coxiella burnetii Q321]